MCVCVCVCVCVCHYRLPGVEHVSVNLLGESADVTFRPAVVALDDLVEAVEDMGYEASLKPQVRWVHAHTYKRLRAREHLAHVHIGTYLKLIGRWVDTHIDTHTHAVRYTHTHLKLCACLTVLV